MGFPVKRLALSLLATILGAGLASGAQWYVAPTGSGNGTLNTPGSLQTAFAQSGWASSIRCGDTVWLLGGTYSNPTWTLQFSGSSGSLVTWRNYQGQSVKIDGQWRFGNNRYHRIWGLELYDSKKGTYSPG